MKCFAFTDVLGVYGNYFHYGLVIFLSGSAFILFLYLWKKQSLHMDEEPKFIVFQEKQGEKMEYTEKEETKETDQLGEIELYGDPGIATFDAKVSKFLIATYLLLPIWGFVTLYYFWNGSFGWLDQGYWRELQIAANTTFPIENQNMISVSEKQAKTKERDP